MVAGNNGILTKTVEAKKANERGIEEDRVRLAVYSALIDGEGKINITDTEGSEKGSLKKALIEEFGTESPVVTGYTTGNGKIRLNGKQYSVYPSGVVDVCIDISDFYAQQENIEDDYSGYAYVSIVGDAGDNKVYYDIATVSNATISNFTENGQLFSEPIEYQSDSGQSKLYVWLEDDEGNIVSNIINFTAPSCFEENTLVYTVDGHKKIKDLEVGEGIYSYNFEKDLLEIDTIKDKLISNVQAELVKIVTENNVIESTKRHRFYTNEGWVQAIDLNKDMYLINDNNEQLKIEDIIVKEEEIKTVYNLEIEKNHNYYITGDNILVHNAPDNVNCAYTGQRILGEVVEIE